LNCQIYLLFSLLVCVGRNSTTTPPGGPTTAPLTSSKSRDSYVITFWIIGLVVLGTLFWLSVLAIALLLCYKRRYTPEAVYAYSQDVTDNNTVTLSKGPNYLSDDHEQPTTFHAAPPTYGKGFAEPQFGDKQIREAQTTSMVIIDDESPEQPRKAYPKDMETQSDSLKFSEESPEWESMDIQLRIDPTGKEEPIITRRERPIEDDDNDDGQSDFFRCLIIVSESLTVFDNNIPSFLITLIFLFF